jgi:hypothetical protein
MPKGKGKGGKNKKRLNKNEEQLREELLLIGEDQVYFKIKKLLGNFKFEADCSDKKPRVVFCRSCSRKKFFFHVVSDFSD